METRESIKVYAKEYEKDLAKREAPGPGMYSVAPMDTVKRKLTNKFSFTRDDRRLLSQKQCRNSPGPSSYLTNSEATKRMTNRRDPRPVFSRASRNLDISKYNSINMELTAKGIY